ncbi:MAG TPA: lipocalin family protein [Pyrinomonadaceae bacterium]|jgi:apolipoprotein D and lipocalin family protein|nr:lipocalin family protein [Pyrinomonadaceae bacterium]
MVKKIAAAGLFVLAAALLVRGERKGRAPLAVVPAVDLSRYAGRWYEVARLPNRFEEKCAGDVSAEYTPLADGRIKVVNRCRKQDGSMSQAEGVARPKDKSGANSRLKVRFAPAFLSFLPFVWGDYHVIELAPDYSHALVGDPSRKYLWLLSRTPRMDEDTYTALTEKARAEGFDVSRLIRTKQG